MDATVWKIIMDDFEKELKDGFCVNIHEVVTKKDLLSVTRLLAADLIVRPYMPVGDFFKNISDSDLKTLVNAVEPENQESHMGDILLLGIMLRTAEGLEQLTSFDAALDVSKQFMTFVIMESLYRKGLIKLHRENMSFGEDMGDKIVAEKL